MMNLQQPHQLPPLLSAPRFISQFSAHLSAHDLWAGYHGGGDDDDDNDDANDGGDGDNDGDGDGDDNDGGDGDGGGDNDDDGDGDDNGGDEDGDNYGDAGDDDSDADQAPVRLTCNDIPPLSGDGGEAVSELFGLVKLTPERKYLDCAFLN